MYWLMPEADQNAMKRFITEQLGIPGKFSTEFKLHLVELSMQPDTSVARLIWLFA